MITWRLGLLIVLAVCLPLWKVIAGAEMYYLSDALRQHYPFQVILGRLLAESPGVLPRWDPWLMCGHPLLADPQFHAWYPPAAVYRFLPYPAANGVFLAAHLVLAAAGTAAFVLRLGYGGRAAGLAAVAFALGSHPAELLVVPPVLCAWAWLPWVALAAHRVAAVPGTASAAFLAVVFGWVALAGYPPYLLYSAVLAGIVIVCMPGAFPWSRVAASAAWGAAGAFAVAAALLLPFLGYLPDTARGAAMTPAQAMAGSMPFWGFLGFLVPQSFLPVTTEPTIGAPQLWTSLHSVGAIALALAVTAVVLRRGDRALRAPLWLVAAGLLLAMGRSLPLFGPIMFSVPPFSFLRHAGLWGALAGFGVAWLAAAGAAEVERNLGKPKGRAIMAGWAVALVFLAAMWVGGSVWKFGQPAKLLAEAEWGKAALIFTIRMGGVLYPAVLLGLGLLVLGLASRREIGAGTAVICLGVLVWADNCVVQGRLQPAGRSEWIMTPSPAERWFASSVPRGAWGRVLVTPRWEHRPEVMPDEGEGRKNLLENVRASLRMNIPAAAGLRQAGGNNPLRPAGTEGALESVLYYPTKPTDRKAAAVFDRLGVRWLVTDKRIRIPGLKLVHDGYARVFERPGPALRPAWVEPPGAGRVRSVESRRPGEWTIAVDMAAPGGVVVGESYVRGWRVENAGGSRAVPVPGGMVGVPLAPGRHAAVRVVYDPWTVKAGLGLSLFALAALFLAGALRRTPGR